MNEWRVITCSFLTALQINGKTYTDLMEQPLILRNGKEKTSVGWRIIRTHVRRISSLSSLPPNTFEQLLSLFDNTKSELRKVVKGVMSPVTDFCAKEEIKTMIKRFLSILNSGHSQAISDRVDTRTSLAQPYIVQVQEALAELVVHQLFREILWVALFVPIDGLADRKSSGRIADLFPEELCASVGCLAQDTVGNLLALIYHMMLLVLREGPNKESVTSYKRHEVMNEVIISALAPMYANPDKFPKFTETIMSLPFIMYEHVLDMNPKKKCPGMNGKDRKGREMEDIVKTIIVTPPNDVPGRHGLPNSRGFYCYRSFTDVFCIPSDFEPLPSS
ncbi:hypothetical protein F4604DRAFT_1916309 [Suillus subluteus]|nr:hypothetical protein F4604DRAFT_1916309 [Suillus subluteus]